MHDMHVVVELIQPLHAGFRRQAGFNHDFPDASDASIAGTHAAALDELFVGLRVVELAEDGPDQGQRRVNGLDKA